MVFEGQPFAIDYYFLRKVQAFFKTTAVNNCSLKNHAFLSMHHRIKIITLVICQVARCYVWSPTNYRPCYLHTVHDGLKWAAVFR